MSEYPFSWKIPPTSSRYWRLFLRNAATTQIYTLSLHDALPISYEVPLAEGNAWLPYRPMLAVTAWREALRRDRKSTRLNSSHTVISYAVFCLKKKTRKSQTRALPPTRAR